MAEGGGEENEENPFSFTKFVRKPSRDSPSSGTDNGEEDQPLSVDLLDGSGANERREEDRRARDTEHDTNPFSFKKFLQTSKSTPSSGPTSLKTLDLANDLPDFVQDHYSTGSDSPRTRHQVMCGDTQRTRQNTDVPLPDFALDSGAGNQSLSSLETNETPVFVPCSSNGAFSLENSVLNLGLNFGQSGIMPQTNTQPAVILDLNLGTEGSVRSGSDSDDGQGNMCLANTAGGMPDFLPDNAGGLPDFLPDSAISGAGARPKVNHYIVENGISKAETDGAHEETNPRILQLQAENAELQRQLQEAREETARTKQRLSAVILANDSHQVKEAEDTAVLERIVQQVETNLRTTTQRALKAEATITKLRKEIMQLNGKVERVQQDNTALQQDPNLRDPLRDKTRYAANQLSAAAKTAEQHLKQLLTGVDTLKMVSDVLLSADKLTDIQMEPPVADENTIGAEGGT